MSMGAGIAPDLARYTRQVIFAGIGEEGQRRLLKARAVVVGCGALGTAIANHLARAGVGELAVVDRDAIELHNLHRQSLFDEEDVRRGLSKAAAAGEKLRRINSGIRVEAQVMDVRRNNIESLIAGADVVLDGTDNFATRYLINDACLKHRIPWIYGGILGASGMTMTILPGRTPCLRCLFAEPPPPGAVPNCADAGTVGPAVAAIGSLQAAEAMKLITGQGKLNEGLITVDLWENRFTTLAVPERTPGCPACDRGIYEFLSPGERAKPDR
jgi:adenylyltransferase/sulfurtransferase